MSIEAVQNLVHCGLKMMGPFESVLTLRAAGVPLRVSVSLTVIGRGLWNIDYGVFYLLLPYL